MSVVAIPNWNNLGVLPPVDPIAAPTSPSRSPYIVSLKDVVMRFASSSERWHIMNGFLRHRSVLHAMGFISGFQWLDGSFMEDVETLEQRPPNDVDVMSFFEMQPSSMPDQALVTMALKPYAKANFLVDAYFLELYALPAAQITALSAYWYSVWAHRRDLTWKGFLQVELAPNEDSDAADWLVQNRPEGLSP